MQPYAHQQAEPANLRWNPDGSVAITWADAHESTYPVAFIREKCPCATCLGTHGPPTTLIVRQSRGGLPIVTGRPGHTVATTVKRTDPIGKYAMRITWGDGHDSGIYAWRYLRSLCQCEACTAKDPT